MAVTAADIITRAKWLAREHAAELDPLTAADWLACVQWGWSRLWALHPQAFHAGSERVGSMPEAPTSVDGAVALADGWELVLAAAAALDAVRALRPADEGAQAISRQTIEYLEQSVLDGLGAR